MPLQIVILTSAKSDIRTASGWYESQQPDLGKRFKSQVIGAIDSLLDPGRGYGPVYMSLSRIFVKEFPYVIYFKTDLVRDRVVVYAILHEKQNRDEILKGRV